MNWPQREPNLVLWMEPRSQGGSLLAPFAERGIAGEGEGFIWQNEKSYIENEDCELKVEFGLVNG